MFFSGRHIRDFATVEEVWMPSDETHSLISLKQNHPSSFVSRCEIIAGVVKLYSRDDVGCESGS